MMLIFDRFCFFFTILLLLKLSYSTGKLRIRVSSSFKTLTPYSTAHRMQLDLINKHLDIRSERKGGTSDNDLVGSILMVQHPHVYTLGSATEKGSGPFSTKDKMGQNLEFQTIQVDRGGQATYHGPGQLVVYPILDLVCNT